jgi:hypothetical protein
MPIASRWEGIQFVPYRKENEPGKSGTDRLPAGGKWQQAGATESTTII